MTLEIIQQIEAGTANFKDVIAYIDSKYSHTPTAFKNGNQENAADQNQGSAKVFAFGKMIANEDMHNGNLSFFLGEDFSLSLAPIYDMLPMRFAPNTHGEVVERDIKPTQATPLTQDVWPEVSAWAQYYWQQVANDGRVSTEFKAIAKAYLGE